MDIFNIILNVFNLKLIKFAVALFCLGVFFRYLVAVSFYFYGIKNCDYE